MYVYEVAETVVVDVVVEHVLEHEGSDPSHEFNGDDETCIVQRRILILIFFFFGFRRQKMKRVER